MHSISSASFGWCSCGWNWIKMQVCFSSQIDLGTGYTDLCQHAPSSQLNFKTKIIVGMGFWCFASCSFCAVL